MTQKKILFPTDFSRTSDAAIDLATSLARDVDGKIIFVHVEEPPVAYGGGEWYYGNNEPDRDELRNMLMQLKPTDPGVECEHRLLAGDPAGAVVDFAKEENVDMIVMGTHGRTGLSRLVMGSVAEVIVRKATCPVLTFKQPAHALSKA